jgi:programmed cell death protein 4
MRTPAPGSAGALDAAPAADAAAPAEEAFSGGLLNAEQRAALDAALASKRAEAPEPVPLSALATAGAPAPPAGGPHTGKPSARGAPRAEAPKTARELAHDRHVPRRGHGGGRPKKAGAGGRRGWGPPGAGDAEAAAAALDRADPNYDSEADEAAVAWTEGRATAVAEFKAAVGALLAEFFDAGDVGEAAARLAELARPEFGHYFVKRALLAALDRHDREREMTSALLAALAGDALRPEQLRRGFSDAAEALEDLALDVPAAPELLALFACRAVADDALPPAWVAALPPGAEALRRRCEAHLSDAHFAERMSRCWGGAAAGAGWAATKAALGAALEEHAAAGDVAEVRRLLRDLAAPYAHHELVKQALARGLAAAGGGAALDASLRLLAALAAAGDVSPNQAAKGFRRAAEALADLELDAPGAGAAFAKAAAAAEAEGWLEPGWREDGAAGAAGANGAADGAASPRALDPSTRAYRAAARAALAEYFESGDAAEAVRRLAEPAEPGLACLAVREAIRLALDRRGRERELAAALLPALAAAGALPPEQAALGFARLLAAADDLALDAPDAGEQLFRFLGRAVVDEVLPPRFLAEVVPSLPAGGLGVGAVARAGVARGERHAGERFAAAWVADAEADAEAVAEAEGGGK